MTTNLMKSLSIALLVALAAPAAAQVTGETAGATDEQPAAETGEAADSPAGATPAPNATEGSPAEVPAGDGAAAPTEQPAQPQLFEKATFKDWRIVCLRGENDQELCNMQQLLTDQGDNPVAQIVIRRLEDAAAPLVAGVEIATPLEVVLSADLRLAVDGGTPKIYRYTFCDSKGCFARFGFDRADVNRFKAGGKAQLSLIPLVSPNQVATIEISLSGFTAAFDALAQ